MKKSLIGILASLGCVACLAGCGASSDLANAADYVKELYKNSATETGADFTRAGFVKINGVDYTIVWTVDVTEGVTVTKNEAGDYVIDVNENAEAAIPYVLTATISDAKGNKETLTYNYTVPKFTELTWQQFVDAEDETAVVIKGVIGGIVNTSNKHELYLQDNDGGYYVYNLDADIIKDLQIGQEIRVRGTRDTYYGVNQVVEASVEVLNATPVNVVAEDITEAFNNAESLKDESLYALQSKLIVIKGATVLGQDASDSSYYNFKLGNKKSYVRISSSACMFGSEDQDTFKAAVAANIGKTADVTGFISIYNNNVYIIPQTKDAFSNFQVLNLTEAEKIDFEKDLMEGFAAKVTSTVALQTKGKIYEDVTITWTSANTTVATVNNGKLVITRPAMDAADVEIELQATLTCGNATPKTATFTIVVPKLPSTVPQALTAAPEVGKTYKMYMEQTKASKTVYAIGAMNGYYIDSTEAQEEAVDITVQQGSAEGKFYLFFDGLGYLNIAYEAKDNGGFYKNISFGREATTDFVWDATYKTLVNDTTDETKKCFLGTRSDRTYTTIGTCDYSYIGQNFKALLCTLVPASQGGGETTQTADVVLTASGLGLTASYLSTEKTVTVENMTYGLLQVADYGDGIQCRTNKDDSSLKATIRNTTAAPKNIAKIVMKPNTNKKVYSGNAWKAYFGTTDACSDVTMDVATDATGTITINVTGEYKFFKLVHANTYTQYFASIEIYYAA